MQTIYRTGSWNGFHPRTDIMPLTQSALRHRITVEIVLMKHLARVFLMASLLFATLPTQAKDKTYLTGKLSRVSPVRTAVAGPVFVLMYAFEIQAGDQLYVGTCGPHDFKPAEWVVKDPVQFRLSGNSLM